MLVATNEYASPEQLREVFSMETPPSEGDSPIQTCAGEWRYEDGRWRFYEDDEWDA